MEAQEAQQDPQEAQQDPPASAADPTWSPAPAPGPSLIGFAYSTGGPEGRLLEGRDRRQGAAARFTRFATRAAAFFADYV